ncbi:hypothetical protein EDEG_02856 [Edhazardia aedis USNM 41457]|uniref:Palmitoyltransferase n=1 Tax=Edhazardia aedis (strain USNM 41457) TaxID=1003232 RepID=J9DN05_EDHAE|nr:hypothetical protein EDEG_02856 [Edhazardia aedis USNM 41457]|eukprot:EJW02747.1 hypothetical protein EDEG_02856 [Edhazardia aedis USNM 41457]
MKDERRKITPTLLATISLHAFLITYTIYVVFHSAYKCELISVAYICAVSIISFHKTWTIDPGYVKPQKHNKYDRNVLILGSNTIINTFLNAKTLTREIATKEGVFIEKLCADCHVFKNNFVSHCRYCDSCILERDHHCSWLNTCIASNNFNFFLCTIFTVLILCCYNIVRFPFVGYIVGDIFYIAFLLTALVFLILCGYYVFLLILDKRSSQFLKSNSFKEAILKNDDCTIFNSKIDFNVQEQCLNDEFDY